MSSGTEPGERLRAAIAAIDRANADDPNTLLVRGEVRPKEQAHAELMTEWVQRLDPDADDAQLLAARAHHLRRWSVPREAYPQGRAGYLRWRRDLKEQHAREVGELLAALGYEPELVQRVSRIVRKQGLGSDPAVQVHEDALCLVFLETQLPELADRLGPEKMRDVARKTMAKMSPGALALAMELPLRPQDRRMLAEVAATLG
jgi:hypothetical protein